MKYSDAGNKLTDLWTVDTRVKASNERLDDKGGLLEGRIDIGYAFWNIVGFDDIKYYLHLSNGSKLEYTDVPTMLLAINSKYPPVLGTNGTTIEFRMSSEVGILKLELEFQNNKGWIKVFDGSSDGTASQHQFTIIPDVPFKVIIQEGFDYEEFIMTNDVPISLTRRKFRVDFRGAEAEISTPRPDACLFKITGRNLDKLWIKYL